MVNRHASAGDPSSLRCFVSQGERHAVEGCSISLIYAAYLENTIYKNQIVDEFFAGWPAEAGSLLLLIPLRLGVEQLNPIYHAAIKVWVYHFYAINHAKWFYYF